MTYVFFQCSYTKEIEMMLLTSMPKFDIKLKSVLFDIAKRRVRVFQIVLSAISAAFQCCRFFGFILMQQAAL